MLRKTILGSLLPVPMTWNPRLLWGSGLTFRALLIQEKLVVIKELEFRCKYYI